MLFVRMPRQPSAIASAANTVSATIPPLIPVRLNTW